MKYELSDITKKHKGKILHRIRALKDFKDIRKGDLGGWVESEKNLEHEGDCWVYDDAQVFDSARVSHNAQVRSNVEVCGNAWVHEDAWVSGRARIYENVRVCGNAWVFGQAHIFGYASIQGHAVVSGDSHVFESARITGFASVFGNARVHGNAVISDRGSIHGRAQVYGNVRVTGNMVVHGHAVISEKFPFVSRSDEHTFIYVPDDKGVMRVIAGGRYFTMEEAREHWKRSRGGTLLGEETMVILDFLEKTHKIYQTLENYKS